MKTNINLFKFYNLRMKIFFMLYIFLSGFLNPTHAHPPRYYTLFTELFNGGKFVAKKYTPRSNNEMLISMGKCKNMMKNVTRRSMSSMKESSNIVDVKLAQRLVEEQFPQWADLSIKPVALGGWDNRTFHLGSDKVLRFPSAADYAVQIEKEQFWLPKLAPSLPLPIPTPLGLGKPGHGYPWHWSVYNWIEGETAAKTPALNKVKLAHDLAQFLSSLYQVNVEDGPRSGYHNFHRGGSLSVYDTETRQALGILEQKFDVKTFQKIWNRAAETEWRNLPVWVHGDISAGNLIVRNGRLSAVIDFGLLSVGDPACDLAIAWTFFDSDSRKHFRNQLSIDNETWSRGRAWALWKALIIAAEMTGSNLVETQQSRRVLTEVMEDFKKNN